MLTCPLVPVPFVIVIILVKDILVFPELVQRFFPGFETIETEIRFDGVVVRAPIRRERPFVFVVVTEG